MMLKTMQKKKGVIVSNSPVKLSVTDAQQAHAPEPREQVSYDTFSFSRAAR